MSIEYEKRQLAVAHYFSEELFEYLFTMAGYKSAGFNH